MKTSNAQAASHRSFDELSARVREAGMLLVSCDMNGVMSSPRGDGDWLSALLERPAIIRTGLAQAAAHWASKPEPAPCAGVPGLWFIPMAVEQRRHRTGYDVVCVPCDTLLDAEQFRSLCQAASIDAEYTRGAFAALPPSSEGDVRRLAVLLRGSWEDTRRRQDSECALEDVGRELAESYEEINLLYSITQNMTDVECPEHFLEVTCEELRQQLPYAWVTAVVQDELGDPTLRRGRVAVAGNPGRSVQSIRSLARALLLRAEAGASIVTAPGLDGGVPGLDGTAIAQPIVREGRIIGLLIAADKEGPDPDASSVDIKLVTAAASHIEIFLENAGLYEDLNAMFLGTLESLTASIDAKDKYTCGHSRRVAMLTRQLAAASGCDANTLHRMHIAGLVHDVGKIGVPERVLVKPGNLDEEEFDWIRRHPEIGHRILRDIPHFDDVLAGVQFHHERWDGRGYPAGISGTEIPLVARMIAIADAFDAMTSSRTYREGMS
ncbi:MAG: HD domain-containing phosphohydrolase, partial [Phycisphaerales bacterium]|nr:HD domain-containing phosphohydrolase [Phycisphaerales bacterium]